MIKVFNGRCNMQINTKGVPYAGAARILGYDKRQYDWVEGIRKAQDAEKLRRKRRELGKLLPLLLASVSLLGCLVAHFMVLHNMYYLSTQRQHPQIK